MVLPDKILSSEFTKVPFFNSQHLALLGAACAIGRVEAVYLPLPFSHGWG